MNDADKSFVPVNPRLSAIPIFLPLTEPGARDMFILKGPIAGFEEYMRRAQEGSSDAQAVVAYMYLSGFVEEENYLENAALWARRSCDSNNRFGYWVLSWAKFESMDASGGLVALSESAARGFLPALYDLGCFLIIGALLPKNEPAGVLLLERAARHGHYAAHRTLQKRKKLGAAGVTRKVIALILDPLLGPLQSLKRLIFSKHFTERDLIYLRQVHLGNELRRKFGNESIGREFEDKLERALGEL